MFPSYEETLILSAYPTMQNPPKKLLDQVRDAIRIHLAIDGQVAAATQNQALSAILFLYRHVLQQELDSRTDAIRAKRPIRLPVVLSPGEARAIIQQTSGIYRLLLQLLYGSGLRLRECLELRIKDIDFAQN